MCCGLSRLRPWPQSIFMPQKYIGGDSRFDFDNLQRLFGGFGIELGRGVLAKLGLLWVGWVT